MTGRVLGGRGRVGFRVVHGVPASPRNQLSPRLVLRVLRETIRRDYGRETPSDSEILGNVNTDASWMDSLVFEVTFPF